MVCIQAPPYPLEAHSSEKRPAIPPRYRLLKQPAHQKAFRPSVKSFIRLMLPWNTPSNPNDHGTGELTRCCVSATFLIGVTPRARAKQMRRATEPPARRQRARVLP